MADNKSDDGGNEKYGQQNASDEVHPLVPVTRVQFGKQPTSHVARQKEFLLLHRGLQQVAETNNADDRRNDVKIVEHD